MTQTEIMCHGERQSIESGKRQQRPPGNPTDPVARLVVISGPSGAGKSTVLRRLLRECDLPLAMSVSATTRPPRPGEVNGVDYHFLDRDEFRRRIDAGDFLEWKEVFGLGHYYGTLRSEVTTGLKHGRWVILEIDVQGALAVFQDSRWDPVSFFIHPGDMNELERRLRSRGTEDETKIVARLKTAAREMKFSDHYRHEIINESVDHSVQEICEILKEYCS
ncbi:Guanylate kinase [Crateriforma conspicua]|uniref:Guanylate kinase n=1 Tax=Crateriforma conspicua TaxID=2527996 RepID=A0A5C6FRM6_9PLAN|nr:guanylate kinase [Crateriforma conspicua]TWT71159.1 Guanylate kinase [Crateriforma conspicua]TWU64906.1 Guanylate kinase [Crateriforma conspicua]